jgi:thioredoxin 1
MLGKNGGNNGPATWPDSPQALTAPEVDDAVKKYPVCVLDFWANRCQPCRVMEPLMNQLAKEYQGKVFFGKVNTDENIELTNRLGIRSIPTFCIFHKAELVQKAEGIIARNEFVSLLAPYI